VGLILGALICGKLADLVGRVYVSFSTLRKLLALNLRILTIQLWM